MEQELASCLQPDEAQKGSLGTMLKDMENLLSRLG
jgi:hypothetical protein